MVLLDSCQYVPHRPTDVQALGCDFLVASGEAGSRMCCCCCRCYTQPGRKEHPCITSSLSVAPLLPQRLPALQYLGAADVCSSPCSLHLPRRPQDAGADSQRVHVGQVRARAVGCTAGPATAA